MSGLQARGEDNVNGVDVREQGSALRSVEFGYFNGLMNMNGIVGIFSLRVGSEWWLTLGQRRKAHVNDTIMRIFQLL